MYLKVPNRMMAQRTQEPHFPPGVNLCWNNPFPSLLGTCFTYTILFCCLSQNNINQSRIMYKIKKKLKEKSMKNPISFENFQFLALCIVIYSLRSRTRKILQFCLLILYQHNIDTLLCSILLVLMTTKLTVSLFI